MASKTSENEVYVSEVLPMNCAARKHGVPARWFKAEADAGRVPHIRAGNRYLFDLSTATLYPVSDL